MSYFYAVGGSHTSRRTQLSAYVMSLVHSATKLSVRRGNVAFGNFEPNKPVSDLLLWDTDGESWLAFLGSPTLEVDTTQDAGRFVQRFFSQPLYVLNNLIDGHFALLAYDAHAKQFYAATDMNSSVPIFYNTSADGFALSSHELALAKFLRNGIDPVGFSEAITHGAPWMNRSRFSGINRLQPAELLTIRRNMSVTRRAYWSAQQEKPWTGNLDDVLDQWQPLLADSVQRFWRSSRTKQISSCDLTAGESSRLVVAQCHALGLPLQTHVVGFNADTDTRLAKAAARVAGVPLQHIEYDEITRDQMRLDAPAFALHADGYGSFFLNSLFYATAKKHPPRDTSRLHFCGAQGHLFRGKYYWQAGIYAPERQHRIAGHEWTRAHLAYRAKELMAVPDDVLRDHAYTSVDTVLDQVSDFPAGTQLDHLTRVFEDTLWGLERRHPFCAPFATRPMIQSIYNLPPRYKNAGRLTRAATERLFPQLAGAVTQAGSPTLRRTAWRSPLFVPEIYGHARKTANGLVGRWFKVGPVGFALAARQRREYQRQTMIWLLNASPYQKWFRSVHTLITGEQYNPEGLRRLLDRARNGDGRYANIVGRVINQEFSVRYVNGVTGV